MVDRFPGVESIVQCVESPGQLPGAEVLLPALLVQISEEQYQQQGHDPGNDHHTEYKSVHDRRKSPIPSLRRKEFGSNECYVFIRSATTQHFWMIQKAWIVSSG